MDLVLLAQESESSGNPLFFIAIIAVLGAVFYFLMIRPQRKMQQKRRDLASSLELGDEVRTGGGIIGTIRRMDDDTVILEMEDGSLIRFLRMAVVSRAGEEV